MEHVHKAMEKLASPKLRAAVRIQTTLLSSLTNLMREEGMVQLLPVMVSPITDPLNHSVLEGSIRYGSTELQLTKSMILHKQLALASGLDGIFIVSPNVRLELPERGSTGRHLLEFSQLDFELRGRKMGEVMRFCERLLTHAFCEVRLHHKNELELFGRELRIPSTPFRAYDSRDLEREYGPGWERIISSSSKDPVWVTNHEREFYDAEEPGSPGTYRNYDIIYPEGFGEGLSGAEREWEYSRILYRMEKKGMDKAPYAPYLEAACMGKLVPSAGAGFGIERMLRYVCGAASIEEVSPFAKVPGKEIVF
ncbi:MAG: asparagine synthetase A [Candidatus Micrarchaeota archaeon]